jgi:hypothetical protein
VSAQVARAATTPPPREVARLAGRHQVGRLVAAATATGQQVIDLIGDPAAMPTPIPVAGEDAGADATPAPCRATVGEG